MSDQMQAGMEEATRLTREGRLAEATAVIQRTLGGTFSSTASPDGLSSADEPMEAPFHVVYRAPQPKAPSRPDRTNKHALRRAPRPPRRHRGEPPWSGNVSGDVSGATVDLPEPAVVPARGGRFVERFYTNAAGIRSYRLYVPSGYKGQQVPLIVMLHGCTQNPDDFAVGTHVNALAETHTFLVAYPAQDSGANMQGCWNWFKAADQQRGWGEPSIIAGITCEVVGEYHVATDGVYVAGMSAGGAMAAIVGEAYPDLYAAIGVHSGLAPGAAKDLPSAFSAMRGGGPVPARGNSPTVPTIVFHGDRDTTVHPRNAEHLIAGRDGAGKLAMPIKVHKGQVPGGYSYTRVVHHDAGGRAIVEQWTVHGLGHAWSGGSSPGSYTDPKGPDASAEMVRFFRQQREPM
jgi:poly(hydroxyalkanoate) depolymerase family esterase